MMTRMNRADLFTLDREGRIRSFVNKVEFTEENTYRKPSSDRRRCYICQRAEWASTRARQKAAM